MLVVVLVVVAGGTHSWGGSRPGGDSRYGRWFKATEDSCKKKKKKWKKKKKISNTPPLPVTASSTKQKQNNSETLSVSSVLPEGRGNVLTVKDVKQVRRKKGREG